MKRNNDLHVNVIGDENCFYRAIAVSHKKKKYMKKSILPKKISNLRFRIIKF